MTPRKTHPTKILVLMSVLLLFPFPYMISQLAANHLEVANSGVLSSGDYAWYTPSNTSLTYLAGYSALPHVGYTTNQVYLNDYQTHIPYSSFTIGWTIELVRRDNYLVNYTVILSGLSDAAANVGRIVESLVVSRLNNTVYSLNGTALGSWPYWLTSQYLAPGATLTLIHAFPEFVTNGTYSGLEDFTETVFTSLPQGTGQPNRTATQDFLDSSLNLGPYGTFDTDRLLVTYPFFRFFPCPGGTSTAFHCAGSNSIWVGIYDRPSGILLAQDHNFWFIDDILLHSGKGIGQIGFHGLSLVLSSTNLNLSPDSRSGGSDVWVPAAVAVGLIAAFGVATVLFVRYRSKPRRE